MLQKTTNRNLNFLCYLLSMTLTLSACNPKIGAKNKTTKHQVPVTGIIYFTSSYCNGARPTEDILKKYNTPKILPNTTLHLRETGDSTATYFSITITKEGRFSTNIPPGIYNIYMTGKYDANALPDYDSTCKQWLEQPLLQVTIKEGSATNLNLDLHLFFHCNPCQIPRS